MSEASAQPKPRMPAFSSLLQAHQSPLLAHLARLRRLQDSISGLITPVESYADLPLSNALGRILVGPTVHAGLEQQELGRANDVAAGIRIEAHHLARFAAAKQTTIRVFTQARIGVVALGDKTSSSHAGTGNSAMIAAMLAGAIESLGAQAFKAACRSTCGHELVGVIRMLAAQCNIVLIAGFLGSRHCTTVLRALAEHGEARRMGVARVRPVGALQFASLCDTPTFALSADPCRAAASFVTLLAPAIRRLQGRSMRVPSIQMASLVSGPASPPKSGYPLIVREGAESSGAQPVLHQCDSRESAQTLANADGVAWDPFQLAPHWPRAVAYFPFQTWCR